MEKKKKEIGASSWLPQYFLFCILGIHGYLTLSQEMVRNDCGKYGIYDAFWTLPPRIEYRDVNHSVDCEVFIFVLKSQFLKSNVTIS